MTNKPIRKRAAALLLAIAVLMLSFPTFVLQAAGEGYSRTADASSMDGWKTLFGKNILSTAYAGTVWTDRSVFTDASAFDGTGITMSTEGDGFLVALSAMASSTSVNGVSGDTITGELAFTDAIGDGMDVRRINGILIGNTLYSGATLSKNFVSGGGDLGTYEQSTALGDEFVRAVRARLGVDGDTARDLIGLAYREGQLRYTSDTDFSNYIGWYANAAGEFLGFWYDGIQTMPDPADPALTDATRPAYIVRSYGYLGAVDETHGVVNSDMMYATVQVRTNIESGAQEMLFSIPAALIPTVTYNVTTDDRGEVTSFGVAGAEHPIRLVYEVALEEEIDEVSVHKYIENGALVPQADGSVVFSANRTADSRFAPSRQNERYVYACDSVLYTDTNGTPYTGDKPAQTVLYSGVTVYTPDGVATVYERVPSQTSECAVQRGDGTWYIPVGTPRVTLENGNVRTALTNNGTLTMIPETGIVLQCFADQTGTDEYVWYTLTRTDQAETATYKARLYQADGTVSVQRVLFEDGVAQVALSPDESLVMYGVAADADYVVAQRPHEQYKLVSVNGDVSRTQAELTTTARRVVCASFNNAKKGFGSVTVVKRILHDFGASYEIPDKQFFVRVTLSPDYADSTLQVDHSGDPAITTVTTDENASFTVTLGHADQLELLRLREGTVVTVTELDVPDGFVPTYYGAGVKDEASVTVRADTAVSILILNRYTYQEAAHVPITVNGAVSLVGRENGEWLDTDAFTVELQRYENGGWVTVASRDVTKISPQFDLTAAMQAERFAQSGVYSYRVIEQIGDLAGVAYDHTAHTFSVNVGDDGMCGYLHILDVTSHHDHTHVGGGEENGWHIHADFTNTYYADGHVEAVIDIRKDLINPSASDLVSLSDHRFALYADGDPDPAFVSDYTDMVGEARLVAAFDTSGEYVYTLRELVPQDPVAGMIYSTDAYAVVIEVTQDAVGALTARVHITLNGETVRVPLFTNRYAPQNAVLYPIVKTELEGRALRDGEFTVQIKEGDTLLAKGVNDKNGDIVFDNALEFAVIGDYYYDVTEVHGDGGGVTYDPIVYRLHILVTDGGNGTLSARYHVINTAIDAITFRNSYKAASVSVVVNGAKQLIGRDLINEEFSFVLVEDDLRGAILSASNFADGTFRFAPITFHAEGTYRYTVHEVFESVAHGIVFDDTVYEVTVTVTDDGYGTLQAQTDVCKDGAAVDRIVFVNEYVTTPAQIVLSGSLYVDGDVPENGEYAVELYTADDTWQPIECFATVQNDPNGGFAFDLLSFDTEGVYYFVVKQPQSEETYRVRVDVTDNHRGNVFAYVTSLCEDGTVADVLLFDVTTATEVPVTTVMSAPIATTSTSAVAATATAVQKDNPQTGDVSRSALWLVLLLVSGGVCMTLAVGKKKRI